ncbi:MAG: DNA primase [Pseudomonadota bacterium]|nr:DNA primase [Pseudomonadota bacterium]
MSLSPAFLDELRARTLLSGVIAPSVKLQKAGREWKACCPFHQEKTPSFTINDDKGFYHCFGCGAHGDAIRFLTDQRGLPFIEAVKELAQKAGMEVPAADPRAQEKAERATGLGDVMTAAQRWFADTLGSSEGEQARDYLKKRGIDPAVTARFGIGVAPNARGRLKAALASFGEDKLVETGMLIKPDEGDSYDRFRGRLMIPIRDPRGRVIAFGGRILGEGEPKYLNSPETPLFDKGRTLYNIDRASPASRKANRLIVVEGYMDVIALDRAGIGEAVAPNGTAVTEAQLERMWRLDPAPILCFDGDSAGQKAAIRAALRALPHLAPERTLRFVALPQGQDPDDLLRSGGKAALDAVLAEPVPLVERLWAHERDAAPLTTPEARAGLKQRLIDHAKAIGDQSLARLYRDEWLERFDALVRPQRSSIGGPQRPFEKRGKYDPKTRRFIPPEGPTGPEIRAIGTGGIDRTMASALLTGFALFPDALTAQLEALAHLPIADRAAAAQRDRLVDAAMSGAPLDREGLSPILSTGGASRRRGGIGFSFIRPETDPAQAGRDLAAAIDALTASAEVEAALAEATLALAAGDDEAFAEQQRLHELRDGIKERLALLAGNE